jgi:hypothetical protein
MSTVKERRSRPAMHKRAFTDRTAVSFSITLMIITIENQIILAQIKVCSVSTHLPQAFSCSLQLDMAAMVQLHFSNPVVEAERLSIIAFCAFCKEVCFRLMERKAEKEVIFIFKPLQTYTLWIWMESQLRASRVAAVLESCALALVCLDCLLVLNFANFLQVGVIKLSWFLWEQWCEK